MLILDNNGDEGRRMLLTRKQKIEHKLKDIFEGEQKEDIKVHWYNTDGTICCSTSIEKINCEQFKQFNSDFRRNKYNISIIPFAFNDEKNTNDPTRPYLKIQIEPKNQRDL